MKLLKLSLTCAMLAGAITVQVQAATLEEVMRSPVVQAFLARPSDIGQVLTQCNDGRYKSLNIDRCIAVRNAYTVSQLPVEMRAIAQNPRSAQALRSLCLSANAQEKASNYLCQELARTDQAFNVALNTRTPADIEREQVEDSRRQSRDTP
jgi:hypothetical protein